ncbi:hypothetical protein C8A00DRAFT_38221 [Chaetomidium leptoderma]|uniref:Ankyrin repeat protein n=1 Tax=Chaetomidium leptoderma TaxID=669021 RepID=A0AAN6VES7_9PEZI|nr:hypothetical protein C8A00DRAFT_38221 [Chaetomidium leptoderma]
MSAPLPNTSQDRVEFQISESHPAQQRTDEAAWDELQLNPAPAALPGQPGKGLGRAIADPGKGKAVADPDKVGELEKAQGKSTAAKKGDGVSKTQKAKESTQKLVALSKRGLSKAAGVGDGKTPGASEQAKATKRTGAAKVTPEEPRDITELRVVFPHDPSAVPRVDVIAIHDVDETLYKAWVYRKKPKRRANESRVYASGGINSHDGEYGLGTAGSPAPGRYKSRQPLLGGQKKTVDDSNHSIERWLAISAKPAAEQETDVSQVPQDDHGPSNPIFAPVEEYEDSSILGMLASVPEDDDGASGLQTPDDIFWQRRLRKRPTLPKEKRNSAGRITTIAEEEKVSSVGEIGESRRHNVDVVSDRQSSLDQGIERRVNWLSDSDMLPNEIPGARVMCYTYKSVEKVPSAWQYLTERAEDLIRRIIQKRISDSIDYGRVPIVLIGLGFGSLILQRAMNLLAIPARTDANPTTDLNIIAGVILLDSPSAGPDREMFPRSRSQETKKTWTQDWLGKARNTSATPSTKIDTLSMWNKFSPIASAYQIPVLWHYSSMVPTAGKPAITPKSTEVSLVPKQSMTAHRLSRFEGPNDVDYRSIVDAVKRSLIVKCSITKSDKLALCLADFLRDKFPVDLRDQLCQTALHLAVKAANPDAVQRLLYQGKASVTRKDSDGRSPLNIAVQEAAYRTWNPGGPPDPDLQMVYTQIINMLVRNGARVDDKDHDGKMPWSYAEGDGNQWIRRLKDKYLIIGSSSTTSRGMQRVLPPQPGPQREACNAFDMIVAEVFLQRKRERFSEVFNFDLASVYDIIYKGSSGISMVLEASRPEKLTKDQVRCRWIHVPSNNEQWIHDLMLSMGIQDRSMGGQRHEGSRLIDRYMMPQARRYKHFHGTPTKTQPEPRPRANRFGSTDSATTVVLGSGDLPPTPEEARSKPSSKAGKTLVPEFTATERDAMVIFMPILGFEKHRHRKYLTQAFREADGAMQIAHARDTSPDPKSLANPKSTGSQKGNQRKAAESSDDGDSNSEKESSRLYPRIRPVVRARARAQIKTAREAQLLNGYLDSKQGKPVHCRRTLDQFSYYMLNSTEARDKSQVAYRWAKTPAVCAEPKNRPIVMVDQLWLWAFHDGTVITSSPNTWNGQEDFNLSNVIVRELRYNKDRPIIKSVEDMLHLVLKTSVDFFKRKGPVNIQFHECFQSSINNVSEQQGHLFENFRHTTKRLHIGTLDPVQRKKEIEFLFSLDEETELLVEIMDIQDELTIVKTILGQQQDVLEKLLRLYPKKADEDVDEESNTTLPGGLGKGELMVLQSLVQLLRDQSAPAQEKGPLAAKPLLKDPFQRGDVPPPGNTSVTLNDEQLPQEGQFPIKPKLKGKEKEVEQPKPTTPVKTNILQNRDLMYETIGIVENNIRIVTDMLAYAEKVESSLENLLDLKQKHANGWEARFAREGSEETQRQGNIILVFTLVTVVFLPLSFITSFFALEIDIFPKNKETGGMNWPIGQVSGYLFGFSAVIFIPLIFLALYVNKLIANVKQIYKQLLKALRDPETLLNPLAVEEKGDHDSDEEQTFVDRRTFANAQSKGYGLAGSNHSGSDDDDESANSSDDGAKRTGRYAPMFGRYHFHRKIALLRNLWRYRRYRRRNARRRDNRWKDTYVRDYPLHYYRAKVNMWTLRMLVAVLAYFGSEKHRRARERNRKRRKLRREEEGSSDSEDSEASSTVSEDYKEVERKDFGRGGAKGKPVKRKKSISSGYWKPGLVANGSREDEMESMGRRWSNQTRSRGSLPGDRDRGDGEQRRMAAEEEKERMKGKLRWLRMRRTGKPKGVVDEEKEIGDSEGVFEGRRGMGGGTGD